MGLTAAGGGLWAGFAREDCNGRFVWVCVRSFTMFPFVFVRLTQAHTYSVKLNWQTEASRGRGTARSVNLVIQKYHSRANG